MIEDGLSNVDFVVMNTDVQALGSSLVHHKIALGKTFTGGLGAGGRPEIGEKAALEDQDEIKRLLEGVDLAFVTAGMGGGTGTGAAPVIAGIAREMGALTVGVVTRPFHFEGRHKMSLAEEGIKKLRPAVDTLICISNQHLLQIVEKKTGIVEAFRFADSVLRQGVQGISDLITQEGMINIDFADVKTIMSSKGDALMGVGYGEGESRGINAAMEAIHNKMLEDVNIEGAQGLLVNVSGGHNFTLLEYQEILDVITANADKNAVIISGNDVDESLGDRIKVTVIAAGFPSRSPKEIEHPVQEKSDLFSLSEWKEAIRAPSTFLYDEEKEYDTPAIFRLQSPLKKDGNHA